MHSRMTVSTRLSVLTTTCCSTTCTNRDGGGQADL